MQKGSTAAVLDYGYVQLIDHMGDETSILEAARMSTQNPTGVDRAKDDQLLEYLWSQGHHSPFEFAELVIEVQCPIFVRGHWHRHRTQSYNEASARYSPMLDIQYLPTVDRIQGQSVSNKQASGLPLSDATQREAVKIMQETQEAALEGYNGLMGFGVARELARINMPLSNYTRFRAKANLRNWFHFLNLRLDEHAQWETRQYADAVADIVSTLWPRAWNLFVEYTLHAETFSRKEMHVLHDFIALCQAPDSVCQHLIESLANKGLTPTQARTFLDKLGVTP